jgi:hypothetical protein
MCSDQDRVLYELSENNVFSLLKKWLEYGAFVKDVKLNGADISMTFNMTSLCVNDFMRFECMTAYNLSDVKLLSGTGPFYQWKNLFCSRKNQMP